MDGTVFPSGFQGAVVTVLGHPSSSGNPTEGLGSCGRKNVPDKRCHAGFGAWWGGLGKPCWGVDREGDTSGYEDSPMSSDGIPGRGL